MKELLIISGPANSGKLPLAKVLLAQDPQRALVHRDPLRAMLGNPVDEADITYIMERIAGELLRTGYSPVICAWNLEPFDRSLWIALAQRTNAQLTWYDTRDPSTQAMIPPLQEEG